MLTVSGSRLKSQWGRTLPKTLPRTPPPIRHELRLETSLRNAEAWVCHGGQWSDGVIEECGGMGHGVDDWTME